MSSWSQGEKELLKTGSAMFGSNPCRVARLVGSRTCAQVAIALAEHSSSNEDLVQDEEPAAEAAPSRRKKSSSRQAHARLASCLSTKFAE